MKEYKIHRHVGSYRLTARYYLADFLKKCDDEFPLYCSITFMRRTSKLRSIVLPNLYKSIADSPNYKALINKEVDCIRNLIMNFPDDGTNLPKRAINIYLDHQSPFRGKVNGLRKAYDKIRIGLLNGENPKLLLIEFNRTVLSLTEKS